MFHIVHNYNLGMMVLLTKSPQSSLYSRILFIRGSIYSGKIHMKYNMISINCNHSLYIRFKYEDTYSNWQPPVHVRKSNDGSNVIYFHIIMFQQLFGNITSELIYQYDNRELNSKLYLGNSCEFF